MGIIYRLTFPNGKVYIGMTVVSLRRRLYCHAFKARQESPKLAVHRAWKLHGEPVAEIIETVDATELAAAEKRQILSHNSFGPSGYNLTPGGEDSPMKVAATVEKVRAKALTPERIARNIEVHLGRKRSPETCRLLSESLKGKGLGVPKSAEHRRKISEANKGKSFIWGRKASDETKAKMSKSIKSAWTNERRIAQGQRIAKLNRQRGNVK